MQGASYSMSGLRNPENRRVVNTGIGTSGGSQSTIATETVNHQITGLLFSEVSLDILISFASETVPDMMFPTGRFVTGLGVGSLSMAVPLYKYVPLPLS